MAGYQTIEALRPILHRGPPPTPVVDIALVRPVRPEPFRKVSPGRGSKGRPGYFVTTAMVARMKKLRAEGWTLHQIGREVGVTHFTVRAHTLDVPPPEGGWNRGGHQAEFDAREACRLRRRGLTFKAIGQTLGCSETCAYDMVRGRSRDRGPNPLVTIRVQAVACVSGIPCEALRAPRHEMAKKGSAEFNKARDILFWVLHRANGMKFSPIGRVLGGFHGTTVADGIRRIDYAIAVLGLRIPRYPAHMVRHLWAAEWPKASA